jgi:nucleotide sugar dehydrogenase
MKIIIIGYGWVGQANGIALSIMGYDVYFFDSQKPKYHYSDKYSDIYAKIKPLSNPLEQDGPLTYYLVCVGDRTLTTGEQDISSVKAVLASLSKATGVVILRSTILPKNIEDLKFDFYVPEFLHEKKAVEECLTPHFFVIGECVKNQNRPVFFKTWAQSAHKTFVGTPEEASYIKYLSNIWNATQIAFVNEFGDLIKKPETQENILLINRVIDFVLGGGSYLRYGKAFSGHCLPKDIHSFLHWHKQNGYNVPIINGVYLSNNTHRDLQDRYKLLPEWYSEWSLPEISLITCFKVITRIVYRKFAGLIWKI